MKQVVQYYSYSVPFVNSICLGQQKELSNYDTQLKKPTYMPLHIMVRKVSRSTGLILLSAKFVSLITLAVGVSQ